MLNLSQFVNARGDVLLDLRVPLESHVQFDKIGGDMKNTTHRQYQVCLINDEEFDKKKKYAEDSTDLWKLTFLPYETVVQNNLSLFVVSLPSTAPVRAWFTYSEPQEGCMNNKSCM